MKKPLTKLQEEVLKSFFSQPIGKSYFLTGGTALSGFYFYHRESIDLDLFTFETIEIEPVRQIFEAIAANFRLSHDHRVATEGYHKFFLTGKSETISRCLFLLTKIKWLSFLFYWQISYCWK